MDHMPLLFIIHMQQRDARISKYPAAEIREVITCKPNKL